MYKSRVTIGLTITLVILSTIYFLEKAPDTPKENSITIGAILPLTGPGSEMGPSTRSGLELFLKQFPSLAGALISLDVENNRGNARDGLSAFHLLQSRHSTDLSFVMTQLSSVAVAIAPLSDQSQLIQFGLAASPSLLQSEYSIRNYASADRIGETMATILSTQSFSTYTILALNDEYGVTVAEAAKTAATKKGARLLLEQRFESNIQDTAPLAQLIIHENPDAVLVTGFGSAPVGIIRKLREAGYAGNIIADPAAAYRPYTTLIGDAAEGLWLVDLDFPNNSNQKQRDFTSAYRQVFNSEPDVPAALAYAGLEVYAAAVSKAGSVMPSEVIKVLTKGFSIDTVLGQAMLQLRDIQYPLTIKRVRNGIAERVDK